MPSISVNIDFINSLKIIEPHNKEVCEIGLVPEERCSYEIVVYSGHCLSWIYVAKFHERRFILELKHKWYTQVILAQVVS